MFIDLTDAQAALRDELREYFGGLLTPQERETLTFGGGVNEIQRELIATAGLGLPRVPR